MCFSAPASFVAAAVTGAMGLATFRQARDHREIPLASVPLFFAVQQAVEGLLWLTVPVAPDGAASSLLTGAFLLLALVFWPVFAPLSTLLIEPQPGRRVTIGLCLAVGIGVAGYLLWSMITGSNAASVLAGHIVYESDPPPPPIIGPLYLVATGLAPALSSHRTVNVLAAIVLVGSVVAYFAYWEAFVSVWCFFATGASAVILMHFARERARELPAVLPTAD